MSLYRTFCEHMVGITPEQSLVVAFSGGLDSTVLLALAVRFASEHEVAVRAVHIKHGLQAAGDAWPAHCAKVAAELGVSCDTIEVQVQLGARISVEAAARQARYQAFHNIMHEHDILLTGHHLDDQAETLLLALKRGAGLAGLASMPLKRAFGPGEQWRPLLTSSRQSLEVFAEQTGLRWVEDPSNSESDFDRNFLRNKIFPLLLAQWPSFSHTAARSAQLCAEQMTLAKELAASDVPPLVNRHGGLDVRGLQALTEARRNNALRTWLQQQGVHTSRVQLTACWQEVALARADASPCITLGPQQLRRYQGALYVVPEPTKAQPLANLVSEQWLDAGVGRLRLRWVEQGATLLGELDLTQLQLVFNQFGLRAQPLGRAGSRPLKKLWQEYAIPPWLRPQMPLLLMGEQLVAVPGLFVSAPYSPPTSGPGWQLEWQVKA